MAKIKILVVDDEEDILEILSYNLAKEDFEAITTTNGQTAIELFKSENPKVIILDIMMDGLDGVETCRQIRELPGGDQPFILFLTARAEEYSQLAGFDAGADDYIPKPVRIKVLIKKIKAMLKRKDSKSGTNNQGELILNELKIIKDEYQVYLNDESIHLRKKEFELLLFLASQPGKVFSRDVLLENVWGNNVHVVDRTIDVHVRKLREKIGPKWIKTVQGVGYKFKIKK